VRYGETPWGHLEWNYFREHIAPMIRTAVFYYQQSFCLRAQEHAPFRPHHTTLLKSAVDGCSNCLLWDGSAKKKEHVPGKNNNKPKWESKLIWIWNAIAEGSLFIYYFLRVSLWVWKVTECGKSSRFYNSDSSEWKSSATPADDRPRKSRAFPDKNHELNSL